MIHNLKKFIFLLSFLSIFYSNLSFGNDIYHKVRFGDLISDIVEKEFPDEFIYGKEGRLKKVISLNPKIKNLNHIYPGQVIKLSDDNKIYLKEVSPSTEVETKTDCITQVSSTPPTVAIEGPKPAQVAILDPAPVLAAAPATPIIISSTPISSKDENSEMGISILLGSKYVSVTQTGAIGSAKLGMLYFDNLVIKSDFNFQEWVAWFQFNSYKFQFDSPAGHDEKKMSAFDLGASYHFISASFGSEQLPLFRNNAGIVQMTRENLIFLSVGIKKEFILLSKKYTTLKLSAFVRIPMSSLADNSQTEISSISGLGVKAQAELSRQIFSNSNYSLLINWISNIGQQNISQNVSWSTTSGNVKSVYTDSSTTLGLLLKF